MKANPYVTAALVFFVVLFGLLILQHLLTKEGFETQSDQKRYEAIVTTLGKLQPFQTLQKDIQQTLLQGLQEEKEPESSDSPEERLRRVYMDGIGDEPMDTSFFNLPPWSDDTEDLSLALSGIPDTLDSGIRKELKFYKAKLAELMAIFSNLKDPSTFQPPPAETTATLEGFQGGQCSAESARLAREALRKKRLAEKYPKKPAGECSIRPLPEEITRVEGVLSRMDIDGLAKEIAEVAKGISKFREDFQKLKDGTLFDWQKAGPKKSYAKFTGKSNADGLIFTLQSAGQV